MTYKNRNCFYGSVLYNTGTLKTDTIINEPLFGISVDWALTYNNGSWHALLSFDGWSYGVGDECSVRILAHGAPTSVINLFNQWINITPLTKDGTITSIYNGEWHNLTIEVVNNNALSIYADNELRYETTNIDNIETFKRNISSNKLAFSIGGSQSLYPMYISNLYLYKIADIYSIYNNNDNVYGMP